jgi:putrescine transport system substrate-binding protein
MASEMAFLARCRLRSRPRGGLPRSIALAATFLAAAVASSEEPVLHVYNWADYIGASTIADFEAETGIRVHYDQYDSAEIVEAKLLAGATGYDVVMHGAQYSSRLIPIEIFQPLDRGRIPNWRHLDPEILRILARYDPGNLHAAPYMWGSTGFAYNVERVRERMPDAPVESGDMIFRPEVLARFADCGVSFLDSPTDVIQMALAYLGRDVNSTDPADLRAAEALLDAVRPHVKYFSSTRMLNDLPNGEVCIAMSWSGDYAVARARAAEAGVAVDLAYTVPSEGSVSWFDGIFVPADAPHPENAHRFIDFVLRPEVMGAITNHTHYASALRLSATRPFVRPEILADPAIYPTRSIIDRLQAGLALPPKSERLRTRAFARVKAGI